MTRHLSLSQLTLLVVGIFLIGSLLILLIAKDGQVESGVCLVASLEDGPHP